MTKAQIIEKVSDQVTTLTKRQAEIVVNTMFNCIRDSNKDLLKIALECQEDDF